MNLAQYAKKGLTENDIMWAEQSTNDAYWAVNAKGVSLGDKKQITNKDQQVILDNGMSFAMAPQNDFLAFAKSLFKDYGIFCQPNKPLWSCMNCTQENLEKIPPLKFNIVLDKKSGKTQEVLMPATSLLRLDPAYENVAWLMLTPWEFQGIGGKQGEEYWVLGAQFL